MHHLNINSPICLPPFIFEQINPVFQKAFILFIFCAGVYTTHAQYWQQQVNYTIDVVLHDTDHTLQGFETITYINHSPDTLRFIYFHLWPNAYKNDRTAFSEQLLKNGNTKFYFSKEEDRGYINQLNFEVDGINANLITDSANIDIAKLILPKPLPPKGSITITTPFHIKLPYNFSRGGHIGQTYQATQWYPKPAVYDSKGWHPIPYLDQGEFYSEYGNWKVTITVPDNYTVAASGDLQNEDELKKLKETGRQKSSQQKNFKLFAQLKEEVKKGTHPLPETLNPPSSKKTKTLTYSLNNAHDFAWFASKLFLVQYDTLQLHDHTVDVFSYYNPWQSEGWQNSVKNMKDATRFYSNAVGTYPNNVISAVSASENSGLAAMEYPTITYVPLDADDQYTDATTGHELGHNWFYGILGSNERDHAWMDEGLNEYYQQQYELKKYGNTTDHTFPKTKFMQQRIPQDMNALYIASLAAIQKDQPIDLTSVQYTENNYNLIVYEKTPLWLEALKKEMGDAAFDSMMHAYFNAWKFKHPYPEDFKAVVANYSNKNIDSLFQTIYSTGPVNKASNKKQIRPAFIFNLKETNKYNYISFSPIAGYNFYDKAMVGLLVHNYQLPSNRFAFAVAPMYATGSSALNGFARLAYYTFHKRYMLETSLSGIRYTADDYTKDDGSKIYLGITRIVPSVKLTLYNKDILSKQKFTIRARSFLMNEEELRFNTIITPTDTTYTVGKTDVNKTINQLSFTAEDNRVLYPYSATLVLDQGKDFLRAGLTAKYFFNYGSSDKGLQVRFFAGKFFYLTSKTLLKEFETDRYHLNLSGANGYEDYTFSNYFIGRNEFEGWQSQQMAERDGFFKTRTDLLASKIGKTDDWLMALNFTTDIPDNINPLSVLPVKIPVKLFADIGTFSEAWKNDAAGGRFLFDAGVQVSPFKGGINIYFPLLYSKVYGDYFKSTLGDKRFAKTISFNINLDVFKLNKLVPDLPL